MRSSREPTAAAFRQWMVLPGDVSLVSKIATEQAVYPGQCWLMPGKTLFPKQLSLSQLQSTATQKRRGAPLILLNCKLVIRRQVDLFPGCWSSGKLLWPVTFWNFIWKQPGGSGQQDYWHSTDYPKKLIRKSLHVYKLEHLGQRTEGTFPVRAGWSHH